jgi:nitroreductase
MDVFEAIKNRRSFRAFTNQPVSEKQLRQLIDAARWAPSAGNTQPWEFILVRRAVAKRKLAEAALDQTFIEEARVVIVVCANKVRSSRTYGDRGVKLYCLQDTAAATQNLLLAAHALGLAACWVGAFKEEEAREVLNIPKGVRPVAIVPIGYPAEKPVVRSRRPVKDFVHYECWGENQEGSFVRKD